jgi:hypothetical protein
MFDLRQKSKTCDSCHGWQAGPTLPVNQGAARGEYEGVRRKPRK